VWPGPWGERSVGTVPLNDGAHSTLLGALGVEGLQAVMPVECVADAEVFRAYVTQVLGPTLAPGDIIVLDNLSAHKAPALSPMKRCLSKLKTALREPRRACESPAMRPSSRPWRPSPPSMYGPGSGRVAMLYSHMKTALGFAGEEKTMIAKVPLHILGVKCPLRCSAYDCSHC
jgi:hypothetical protein